MTKINITLPVNKELFERLRSLDWQDNQERQILLDKLLYSMWSYEDNDYPTPDQQDFADILKFMVEPKYYHPREQQPLSEWIRDIIVDRLVESENDVIEKYARTPDELTHLLFEREKTNGSYYYHSRQTRDWINDFAPSLSDCGLYNSASNFNYPDPIDEPERYHAAVIYELAYRILSISDIADILRAEYGYRTTLKDALLEFLEESTAGDLDEVIQI